MEAAFCIEAVEEALAKYGRPDIFITDQENQFTSAAFTGVLLNNAIAISMDGKGSWRDNVFVERIWKSVKYEEVYLNAYASVGEARASIDRYLDFYNRRRPHASLDRQTPDEAYLDHLPQRAAAWTSPRFGRATPVGLRPPCVAPPKHQPENHLSPARSCSDNRSQLCLRVARLSCRTLKRIGHIRPLVAKAHVDRRREPREGVNDREHTDLLPHPLRQAKPNCPNVRDAEDSHRPPH